MYIHIRHLNENVNVKTTQNIADWTTQLPYLYLVVRRIPLTFNYHQLVVWLVILDCQQSSPKQQNNLTNAWKRTPVHCAYSSILSGAMACRAWRLDPTCCVGQWSLVVEKSSCLAGAVVVFVVVDLVEYSDGCEDQYYVNQCDMTC